MRRRTRPCGARRERSLRRSPPVVGGAMSCARSARAARADRSPSCAAPPARASSRTGRRRSARDTAPRTRRASRGGRIRGSSRSPASRASGPGTAGRLRAARRSPVTWTASRSIRSRPAWIWPARMASAQPPSTSSSGRFTVMPKSWRTSASTQPSAEVMPGYIGTRIFGTPSSRASTLACSGPAPPNAKIAKSRGSKPFSTETKRIASAIDALATARIAAAAASASRPSGRPIRRQHLRAHVRDVGRLSHAVDARRIDAAEQQVRVGDRSARGRRARSRSARARRRRSAARPAACRPR